MTPSTSRAISGAEHPLDVVERRDRVLDRVVQQPGDDRGAVELHPGEDAGDLDRMREIRIARGAQLRAMRLHRIDIGAVERVFVGIRVVGLDPLDQLELAHHDDRLRGLPAASASRSRHRDGSRVIRGSTPRQAPVSRLRAPLRRRPAARLLHPAARPFHPAARLHRAARPLRPAARLHRAARLRRLEHFPATP